MFRLRSDTLLRVREETRRPSVILGVVERRRGREWGCRWEWVPEEGREGVQVVENEGVQVEVDTGEGAYR